MKKNLLRPTPKLHEPPTPEMKAFYADCLNATEALKTKPEKRLKLIDSLLKRYL